MGAGIVLSLQQLARLLYINGSRDSSVITTSWVISMGAGIVLSLQQLARLYQWEPG
jgi:hypothetical protein